MSKKREVLAKNQKVVDYWRKYYNVKGCGCVLCKGTGMIEVYINTPSGCDWTIPCICPIGQEERKNYELKHIDNEAFLPLADIRAMTKEEKTDIMFRSGL